MAVRRILFVIPASSKPGAMSFVHRLACALRAEGAEVHEMEVRTVFRPWVFFPQGLRIRRLAISGEFDVINAQYGTYTGLITALFTCFTKPSIVVTFRGSDLNPVPSENPFKWVLQHFCSQVAAWLADGVICVSGQIWSRIWSRKRFYAIVPSSIDLERFRPMDLSICRRELGWIEDQPICVFFPGNNPQVKRLDLALEIRSRLQAIGSPVRLEILYQVELEQMPLYLNAADCLVFLSDFEGSPNLIREACACGLPIVSVDVGDISELLKGVVGCSIVERNLTNIVETVIRTAEMRVRSNGVEKVQRFGNSATAKQVLRFYSCLLEESGI